MISSPVVYPQSPTEVRGVVKETSGRFRKEVGKVLTSIILFFIVYVILVVLAVILAVMTVYGGIAMIISAPKFLVLMIGAGLIGFGLMVLFFLVKFIFAVSRFDHSNSIEITEKEQPVLFDFIRKLSNETETAFPKKIYISPEVNACVFYDSSFWSMMLPVKKNLQIGLGLVNVLTVSEFKAVVAHEFGHFSQRSMKLGSFVYNVNKIIYNMLYHNRGYGNTLNAWANIHTLFAIFAALTVKIVQGIQWVLQKMYALINRNYMSLSREMEFHADAVAASVSGSNSLITALRRLDLADSSYSLVLNKYNDLLKEKLVADNLYNDHQTVMHLLSKEQRTGMSDAAVNGYVSNEVVQNRVNYKDQWASHPPVAERTKQLAALNIIAEENHESAWTLFEGRDLLQQQLTKKIYDGIAIPEEATSVDAASFQSRYIQEQETYKLPPVFNGFFDSREISAFDVNLIIADTRGALVSDKPDAVIVSSKHDAAIVSDTAHATGIDTKAQLVAEWQLLLNRENLLLPKKINGLRSDISILESIEEGNISVKSFDFDGKKFAAKDAATIKATLMAELNVAEKKLVDLDNDFLRYFYKASKQVSPTAAAAIETQLRDYNHLQEESARFLKHVNETLALIGPFYSDESLTYDSVNSIVTELKTVKEPAFKVFITYWLPVFESNTPLKSKAESFLQKDYRYFFDNVFVNEELDEYNQLLRGIWMEVSIHKFKSFKKLVSDGVRKYEI